MNSESQGNIDGSMGGAENSGQLNRTQSINQMFNRDDPDHDADLNFK